MQFRPEMCKKAEEYKLMWNIVLKFRKFILGIARYIRSLVLLVYELQKYHIIDMTMQLLLCTDCTVGREVVLYGYQQCLHYIRFWHWLHTVPSHDAQI